MQKVRQWQRIMFFRVDLLTKPNRRQKHIMLFLTPSTNKNTAGSRNQAGRTFADSFAFFYNQIVIFAVKKNYVPHQEKMILSVDLDAAVQQLKRLEYQQELSVKKIEYILEENDLLLQRQIDRFPPQETYQKQMNNMQTHIKYLDKQISQLLNEKTKLESLIG